MNTQPTAFEVLSNPTVIEELQRAYFDSGIGSDNPIEQGGFIVLDEEHADIKVARLPPSGRDTLKYPICSDGYFQGMKIVGTFHTHPNTGPEWQQEPSQQDIHLSQEYPETMGLHQFVIGKDEVYHISNDGDVVGLGATRLLLGLEQDNAS